MQTPCQQASRAVALIEDTEVMFFVFFQGILEICEEDNIVILGILKSDFSVDDVGWSGHHFGPE